MLCFWGKEEYMKGRKKATLIVESKENDQLGAVFKNTLIIPCIMPNYYHFKFSHIIKHLQVLSDDVCRVKEVL